LRGWWRECGTWCQLLDDAHRSQPLLEEKGAGGRWHDARTTGRGYFPHKELKCVGA